MRPCLLVMMMAGTAMGIEANITMSNDYYITIKNLMGASNGFWCSLYTANGNIVVSLKQNLEELVLNYSSEKGNDKRVTLKASNGMEYSFYDNGTNFIIREEKMGSTIVMSKKNPFRMTQVKAVKCDQDTVTIIKCNKCRYKK